MTIHPILIAPDRRLKTRCAAVTREEIQGELHVVLEDMLETMYDAPGIGLAAPQIGILKRLVVIDLGEGSGSDSPGPICMINPELAWVSEETAVSEEGCLSVPDFFARIERPEACEIHYLDKQGQECRLEAHGLLAVCAQHEIDHLNGILFLDHLSSLKRNMILRKLTRARNDRSDRDD